ncbi:MAG: protein-disulfide reductase DsbD domain-containing protein, partial [Limisphaerales bacterium]
MDRTKQFALLFILFALTTALSRAQDPQPQTTVALFLSHETARPGETVLAAVELTSAPEWHTYWRNSGDSGLPTKIEWELPAGVTAGEIQWPIPKKKELLQVAAYVYE